MTRLIRLLALLSLLALSVALTACGGVSDDAVAEVDGEAIEKTEFNQYMTLAAKQQGATVPKPPTYTACIAAKRKQTPPPAKGQPKITDEALKSQCKQEYENLRNTALGATINSTWIEKEAEEQGIKLTDAEVRKSFETQKKQQFPKEADYKAFLKQSGQTEAQLLQQVRTTELANKITEKVTKGKDEVSDAEVATYYKQNTETFGTPETRDARVVLTRDKAKARRARAALEGGDSWAKVAKKYSVDPATKNSGGKVQGIAEGTEDTGLQSAVFKAKKDQLVGPVKTQFGYYVFEVEKTTKATQQTLAESRGTIRQTLGGQKKDKALQAFVKSFNNRWKEKTECAEGYQVPDLCSNAPAPKNTPTPTPAG